MASSPDLLETLRHVRNQLLQCRVGDFPGLREEISLLNRQVAIQAQLEEITPILHARQPLDSTRRNRLKFLIQHVWGNRRTEDHASRLRSLEKLALSELRCDAAHGEDSQALGCQAFVLLAIVFKPGSLLSMKRDDFEYLMSHTVSHIRSLQLPYGWIYHAKMPSLIDDNDLRDIVSNSYGDFVDGTVSIH
jgi:hypothetical protein